MPYRSSVPMVYRKPSTLTANKCKNCNKIFFPKQKICSECFYNYLEDIQLSGNGTVLTFTKIHTPPSGFETQTPYFIAIIQLYEGPKITAQIDAETLKIADKVQVIFRKINQDSESGLIDYGFKFELVD